MRRNRDRGRAGNRRGNRRGPGAGGAKGVLTARRIDEVAAVANRIAAQGVKALPVKADAAKKADAQAMSAAAIERFGAIDILLNNAGIEGPPTLTAEIPNVVRGR